MLLHFVIVEADFIGESHVTEGAFIGEAIVKMLSRSRKVRVMEMIKMIRTMTPRMLVMRL